MSFPVSSTSFFLLSPGQPSKKKVFFDLPPLTQTVYATLLIHYMTTRDLAPQYLQESCPTLSLPSSSYCRLLWSSYNTPSALKSYLRAFVLAISSALSPGNGSILCLLQISAPTFLGRPSLTIPFKTRNRSTPLNAPSPPSCFIFLCTSLIWYTIFFIYWVAAPTRFFSFIK